VHQYAPLNECFPILFPAFFMETDTLINLPGTVQKNIPGMDVLEVMPFPLPLITEQRRIVAKADQLMALAEQLETKLAASRVTVAKLLEAMLAELTAGY
jgi:type I restriction enzyme, S subunit